MNDVGHELRHIMFMTGHKNEASIRSYNRHCSVQQKKLLSSTLSRIAMGEDMSSNDQLQKKENVVVPTDSRAIAHSNIPTLPSSSSQQRDTIAPLQKPTLPSSMQIPSIEIGMSRQDNTSNVLNNASTGILSNSAFSNCVFNINIPGAP